MSSSTLDPAESYRPLVPPGIQERWAEVRGKRMRYLTAGKGPPLIFIAGLLGFSFSWTENLAFFARHFTVYAPDLLNTGYSDPAPGNECSLKGLAQQILDFMDGVGAKRALLIGSSHGATLTLLMASLQPDRVERVVACAPPHPWSKEARRFMARLFASPLGPVLGATGRMLPMALRRIALYPVYAHVSRVRKGTIEGYSRAVLRKPVRENVIRILRCWAADFDRLAEDFAKISCPVLLLWGDEDVVVPLSTANELQRNLQCAELSVIRDCGHLPYEELPDEFNRRVLDWLLRPAQDLC